MMGSGTASGNATIAIVEISLLDPPLLPKDESEYSGVIGIFRRETHVQSIDPQFWSKDISTGGAPNNMSHGSGSFLSKMLCACVRVCDSIVPLCLGAIYHNLSLSWFAGVLDKDHHVANVAVRQFSFSWITDALGLDKLRLSTQVGDTVLKHPKATKSSKPKNGEDEDDDLPIFADLLQPPRLRAAPCALPSNDAAGEGNAGDNRDGATSSAQSWVEALERGLQ